jgi:HEAT repeat protein
MRWFRIGLAILLVCCGAAGGWFYAMHRARSPEAVRRACLSRLETLGRALEKYVQENDGRLPAELTDLYPGYIDSLDVCESPRSFRSSVPEPYHYENRATPGTHFTVLAVYDPPGSHEAVAMGSHAALMRNGGFVGVKTFSDDEIRMLASAQDYAFDYFQTGNQTALQGLLDIMKESEGTVRQVTTEMLSLAPKPDTAKFLVRELAREQVQEEAAEVLTSIGQGALPDLARACDDPDPSVRAKALRSLGDIGDESAIPTVIDKLADEDEEVRTAAAHALGKMNAANVIPHLTRTLTEGDPETQERIASTIPDIGASLIPGLKAALERGDAPSRQVAAFMLGKLKAESAVPALGRATEDTEWTVAWFALQALAEIGTEDCVEYLTAVLDKSLSAPGVAQLHAAAVQGLGTMGGDSARAKLREVLARRHEPNEVRSAAAQFLGKLQDRDAVPVLIETMSKFYYLRTSCAEALREITGYDFGTRPELWKNWWDGAPQPPPLYGDMVYVVPPPPPPAPDTEASTE